MTTAPATVSLRTAWMALGGVGMLGLAGIVAALAVPMGGAPMVEAPKVAAPAPLPVAKLAAAPKPAVATASAAPTSYAIGSFIPRPTKFSHGDWIWSADDVAPGPVVVIVDVKTQLIHVFRSGREIGVAVALYGADDSPTPLGVHSIRWMRAKHRSSIFGSSMPYTLNLTGDGIAVHGSNVRWGWGTNGCVGVPIAFAKLLFEQVKTGDRVVIVKGGTPQPGQNLPLA